LEPSGINRPPQSISAAVVPGRALSLTTRAPFEQTLADCQLATECPVTIDIADAGTYTTMCTPTDLRALAVGLLFTEGIVENAADIGVLMECPDDPNVLRVILTQKPSASAAAQGHRLILSSCGLCGSQTIAERMADLPAVAHTFSVNPKTIELAMEHMREQQRLYSVSSGTHAAALFDCHGRITAFAEDIGRHNALDKAIGKRLLTGRMDAGLGVCLSGRVSFEMLTKCARAGIELIAAVSAPTSLAVHAAERCGITLCGRVREGRATVFCGAERLAAGEPTGAHAVGRKGHTGPGALSREKA